MNESPEKSGLFFLFYNTSEPQRIAAVSQSSGNLLIRV
jgi:hypothetical protein